MPRPIDIADWMGTAGGAERIAAPGRRHLPGVDGLRGTAILAVMICHYAALLPPDAHALAGLLEFGWAGVDLFFVISGFLITGILLDAKGTPHYFRNFYARRVLRIVPLYYAFLVALLVVLLFAPSTPWAAQLRSAQPWLWTYTANVWIGAQKHWTTWAETVIPLWSLSVEEQFYLIWPVAVLALSRRAMVRLCLAIMLGALATRLLLTWHGVDWFLLYTGTPTRADALAAGALVALLLRGPSSQTTVRTIARYAAPAAALTILLVSHGFDPTRHPWLRDILYTALAVLFAALLFWSIDAGSLFGLPKRFYESRWLRTIGGYSYGIYVLHLPVMYLCRSIFAALPGHSPARENWTTAVALIVMSVLITSILALASYHLLEKQFLKLKRHFPARQHAGSPKESETVRTPAATHG